MTSPGPSGAAPSRSKSLWSDLGPRVLSAAVIVVVIASGLYFGGYVFAALAAVVFGITYREWEQMVTLKPLAPFGVVLIVLLAVAAVVFPLYGPLGTIAVMAVAVIVSLFGDRAVVPWRVGGLVAQAQPDVVLVHLGTNDVLAGQSASGIAAELGGVIDAIRAGKPDAHILLAKIIPAAPDPSGTAALNRLIDGVASGRSSATSPIAVVNQASGYSTGDNYDGVHPNVSGESKLGNRWADAVLAWRTQ